MKRIAVIIPACLQSVPLLDEFRSNLRTFRHPTISRVILLCNRLSLMTGPTLEALLSKDLVASIQVIHDKERSVAGAWNRGIEVAIDGGIDNFLVTAVDVAITDKTVDSLIKYGCQHPEVPIWSSTANDELADRREEAVNRCDFSCFMLRSSTIHRHGWFDKEYKPAYFEDNDYITRVVLAGDLPKQVIGARHLHSGSLTIRLDAEMAHHVRHWFHGNANRFQSKWATRTDDYAAIPHQCFSTPFNSGRPLSWWPEQERQHYSPSGGIHE